MPDAELEQLLSCYYHEDFEGVWEPLAMYLGETTDSDVTTLVSDIDSLLLANVQPEFDLPAKLWKLGSYLYLGDEPLAYAEWIREVRRRCVAHLER